ncbi:MAG: CoA transferase [Dehalococcoidia bacterium]|nr:CoA transferase [Dehalococcoidia bacterium]
MPAAGPLVLGMGMTAQADDNTALGGIRVLDLCDAKGVYCTKLLAEMGADVVKIEPPGGDATRAIGPFVHDVPHPERSLFFMHYNTSKRGVTLDIEAIDGQKLFRRLIEKADVLVETFPPGYLESLGFSYAAMRDINPGLIVASVTDFGQTGPYCHFKSSNLVACSLGGMVYTAGDVDTPPLVGYGNQAYHTASHFGAIGVLMALYHRSFTGEGQQIDISMQEAIAAIIEHTAVRYFNEGVVAKRQGTLHWSLGFRVFETRDGHALISLRQRWDDVVAWLDSEGIAEDLTDPMYDDLEFRKVNILHIIDVLAAFARTKTTDELVEFGQLIRLPFGKVRNVEELVDDEHLLERGFWVPVEHPEIGAIFNYPGAPFKAHGSPWRLKHRSPLIGEHNLEVYRGELGLSDEEMAMLRQCGVI